MAYGIGHSKLDSLIHTKAVEQGRYDYKPSSIPIEVFQQSNVSLKIPPQTSLTSEGPWTFNIPSMENHAINMKSVESYCRAKIVKENGADCIPEPPRPAPGEQPVDVLAVCDVVAPINLLAAAMHQTVDVSLNTRPMPSESGQHANYKAYMDGLLSYSDDARQTHMTSEFFAMDEAFKSEVWEAHTVKQNHGFMTRWQSVEGSREFEFMGPVHHPFLSANNNLASGNVLSLRIQKPSDDFLLFNKNTTGKKYKIQILEYCLYVTYIRLPDMYAPPDTQIYLFNDSVLRQAVLPVGTPSALIPITNYDEIMPKQLVFGMTATDSVNGSLGTNPWNFAHFNMSELNLVISGSRYPNNPLTFDYTGLPHKPLLVRAFRWVFQNSGMLRADRGASISQASFAGGSMIIPFDLTPDQCNQTHEHKARRGKLEIEIKFRENLKENVTVHYLMTRRKACVIDARTGNFEITEVTV
jgi:hypothetical protein